LYKSLKDTKLKITPTCFRSYVIHHQEAWSCTWLKLLVVVHWYLSCAWSVFGSVILNQWCVCVCVCVCVYGKTGSASGWNCVLSWSCTLAVVKPVQHVHSAEYTVANSWWWVEKLPETRRVSYQNKYGNECLSWFYWKIRQVKMYPFGYHNRINIIF